MGAVDGVAGDHRPAIRWRLLAPLRSLYDPSCSIAPVVSRQLFVASLSLPSMLRRGTIRRDSGSPDDAGSLPMVRHELAREHLAHGPRHHLRRCLSPISLASRAMGAGHACRRPCAAGFRGPSCSRPSTGAARQRWRRQLLAITSALPPTTDIRWPMSASALISSALPLKADVAAVDRESPQLTQLGHSRGFESNGSLRPETVIHWDHIQGPLPDQKADNRAKLLRRRTISS